MNVETYCMMGVGPIDARVLLCGEAPGADEDRNGKPFVGKAGELLRDEWSKALGFPLTDVFVTNCVKCRPPKNRNPYQKEMNCCSSFLKEELDRIRPKLVVAVGRIASKALGLSIKISRDTGKVFYGENEQPIIPLLHPAAVLRKPRDIKTFRDSLGRIKTFLEQGHKVDLGEYEIVEANDYVSLERLLEEVRSAEITDIDIETNGIRIHTPTPRLKCISFSPRERRSVTVNLEGWEDGDRLAGLIRSILGDPTIRKCGHRLAFEYVWLKGVGRIQLRGIAWDTKIGAFEEDKLISSGLKDQAWRIGMGGYEGDAFKTGKDTAAAEGTKLFKYCAMDADATGRIRRLQEGTLSEAQRGFIERQSLPLIPVLSEMHLRGLRIDQERLSNVEKLSSELIEYLEVRIRSHKDVKKAEKQWDFGDFNPRSTRQVRFIVYGVLGAPVLKRSPGGAPSTDEETLKQLEPDYPSLIRPLLDYRTASKFKSTYITAVRRNIAEDGRIHATYSQTTARSGRLASQDPNVQNWPHQPENLADRYPEKFAECFAPRNFVIPEEGCELWGVDFSQIELRVAAAVSQCPVMVKIFKEGGDLHRETALIFDSDYDDLPPERKSQIRRFAKTINFGVIYGMSAYELAKRTGMHETKAKEFISGLFRKYWGYAKWVEETKKFLDSHGYVETPTGRRRNFPPLEDLNEKDREAIYREAVNTPIQGPASDLCANALLRMDRALRKRGLKSFWINSVHDENIANGYPEEWEDFKRIYEEIATNPPEWIGGFLGEVPLLVDWKRGPSWGGMEEVNA
jgi:DNA polymerase-1